MPEAPEVQQLPSEAKIFAKFSSPNIRVISQLCITLVTEDAPEGHVFVCLSFWNA